MYNADEKGPKKKTVYIFFLHKTLNRLIFILFCYILNAVCCVMCEKKNVDNKKNRLIFFFFFFCYQQFLFLFFTHNITNIQNKTKQNSRHILTSQGSIKREGEREGQQEHKSHSFK